MTAKKKVIIDNDDILLYYPLTRDWCSYHEPWCKGFGGEQSKSEEITKIVNNRSVTFFEILLFFIYI